MIQIEFLAPNAAPAKSGARAAGTDAAASFLSVLTRETAHPESAQTEVSAAADHAATGAAEPDQEIAVSAMDEIDLEPEAETAFDADAHLFAGEADAIFASHEDRVATAIDAATAEAAVTSDSPAAQVAREEAAEDARPADEEEAVAADVHLRQATESASARETAAVACSDVYLPFRADAPAAQVPPRPDQLVAGGTGLAGGAADDSAAFPSGGTMPRAADASPTQPLSSSTAPGALAGSQITALGLPVLNARRVPAAQAEADTAIPGVDQATLRVVVEPRGNVAVPGAPTAAPENIGPFALFAGDGMRNDGDLPARRPADPANLAGDFAVRVTGMNGASPTSVRPVHGTPEPALALAGVQVSQIPAWAETAEGAAQQASGDDATLVAAMTTSQSARAYPVLFAAAEPQRVTQQIAEAVRRSTDGSIELALSPKELGSVRMSIHATETGTAIVMIAERDETMQLLRRHAEMLHDAFRDLGLGTLDLRFGGRDGKAAQPDPGGRGAGEIGSTEAVDASQQPAPRMMSGGLDLRM